MTLPLQQLDGKYDILHKIQEGGMGAIYKVRHLLLEETRVIKVIRPEYAGDENLQRRFRREAKTAIRLRHANIAQLYDFAVSDEDGTSFIVMEYIDGVTLQEVLLQSGPPPLGLALEIADQSLHALAYLHHQGYVHRDVSSDNLMLTRDFRGGPLVKLIDLGIAKHRDTELELTQTGMFMGKVRYAPPEQFSAGAGEGPAQDNRSDVYSFGILLYELLTGSCPIVGESVSELIAAHLFRPPLPFAEADPEGKVPEALRALVLRALEKNPQDRFADADEFIAALAPLKVGRPALRDDLEQVLHDAMTQMAETADHPRPGSTQGRLNRQFNPVSTPNPALTPEPASSWRSEAAPASGAGSEAEAELDLEREPGHSEVMELLTGARQAQRRHEEEQQLAPLDRPREVSTTEAAAAGRPNHDVEPSEEAGNAARAEVARDSASDAASEESNAPTVEVSDLDFSHAGLELGGKATGAPGRSRAPLWAAAGLAVVLVAAGLLWWKLADRGASSRSGAASSGIGPAEVETSTDAALAATALAGSGTLVLNAVPWGRVEAIVDAAGDEVALAGDPNTPLRLELPAGRYTLSLVNPPTATRREVELEIRAASTTRETVELAPVDARGYVERTLAGSG